MTFCEDNNMKLNNKIIIWVDKATSVNQKVKLKQNNTAILPQGREKLNILQGQIRCE